MFKKISEAYAVLSNPDRRKKYDMWGQTSQDDGTEPDFSDIFDDLFGGGMGFGFGDFDEMDDFINILEQDNTKSFKQMFRGLGKNYRQKGGRTKNTRGAKNKKGVSGKKEDQMMDDMMAMMMMGAMGLGGEDFDMPKNGGKKKPKKKKDDDSWEDESSDDDDDKKKTTKSTKIDNEKDDDSWEDCSD